MVLEILYEDAYCLIVNKPNDLLVHHSHYARNIEEDSMVELLIQMGFETPIPVHRLDRKTSGVLLVAKKKEYVVPFQELFSNQPRLTIKKTYLALLRGHVAESGEITSPVKNDRGNYKEAHTNFRCLKQYTLPFPVQPYSEARYSLVEFSPITGRMHQLRIHANKISHPIIGDPKYGNRHHNHYFADELGIQTLFLHAKSLEFEHPISKEQIKVEAELPAFWNFLKD